MTKGYWQVPLEERSIPVSAFVTPAGQFQWRFMPFGLRNAPATFSRLVQKVLKGLEPFASAYLDDILIFSTSWDEHLSHLAQVLNRIRNAGLTLNVAKCEFAHAQVEFLGHVVGRGIVQPRSAKIKAVLDFPRPTTKKQIQSFLGLAGYYRRFIPHFSHISAALTSLLQKNKSLHWTDKAEEAFLDLKSRLASRPILVIPDFSIPFVMAVDASDVAIGAVLFQEKNGLECPVCFFSKKLNVHERQYSTVEKEALALVKAVRVFSVYFGSANVVVYTDHNPLTFLHNMRNHNAKLLRWSLELQEYSLTVKHRAGKDNLFPDVLSRPSDM
jgi:hypothetical protein